MYPKTPRPELLALSPKIPKAIPDVAVARPRTPRPVVLALERWTGGATGRPDLDRGERLPVAEGGRFAEVYADATTVWPLLMKGVLEELGLS